MTNVHLYNRKTIEKITDRKIIEKYAILFNTNPEKLTDSISEIISDSSHSWIPHSLRIKPPSYFRTNNSENIFEIQLYADSVKNTQYESPVDNIDRQPVMHILYGNICDTSYSSDEYLTFDETLIEKNLNILIQSEYENRECYPYETAYYDGTEHKARAFTPAEFENIVNDFCKNHDIQKLCEKLYETI